MFTFVHSHSLLQNLKQSSIVHRMKPTSQHGSGGPSWADPTSLPHLVPLLPVCVALALTSPLHALHCFVYSVFLLPSLTLLSTSLVKFSPIPQDSTQCHPVSDSPIWKLSASMFS